jgi:hypothetical protein
MAYVAYSIFAGDFRLEIRRSDRLNHSAGNFSHCQSFTGTDVEGFAGSILSGKRQAARGSDIIHTYEIPLLQAVLIDERSFSIEYSDGEVTQGAGIRV